jgi:hypothetical protein
MEPTLRALTRNESVGGRPLRVEKRNAHAVEGCQLIFIGQNEAPSGPPVIKAVDKRPVLTVGEDADFLRDGGMIRFMRVGNRVRFEINVEAAERAGLQISSRLLRLAEAVRVRDPGK